MSKTPTSFSYLLILLLGASTQRCMAQTPTIAQGQPFTIPMSDKTTANAIILPAPNNQAWLVYSTPTGQIGFWTMTPATNPHVPPQPPKPAAAAVISIGETIAENVPPAVAKHITEIGATYNAWTVSQITDPTTSAEQLKWIGRTAGKTYPYTFVADAAGKTLWEGPTPTTDAAYLAAIDGTTTAIKATPCCPNGNCQRPQQQPNRRFNR